METLIINIPDKKSALVKQILKELGVTIESKKKAGMKPSDYAKLIHMTEKEADDMQKHITESRNEWERDI